MREDTVAFYTAMEIPVAEALGRALGAERVFQRIGKEEAIRLHK